MLFDGLIQRKLASLLRPWLTQEPDWEVKLGIFRSLVVARNLRLDIAALNRLIAGGGSDGDVRLSFKKVTIDEVTFRVAHWSAPAFTLEVRGVHVTLFPEKPAQGGVVERTEESFDDYLEKRKKKVLAQIDPGGTMLHDSMEKIMMDTASKICFKNSLINLLLMHCCLHLHDACVQMEFPVSDGDLSWLCYAGELNAGSAHREMGCFFGGFLGLLFLPFRETYFKFEAHGLEIGAEKKDHSSCIFSCVNPYIGIRFKDLRLVNFMLSVPEMNFSFSPTQLQMMVASSNLLYTQSKNIRSGRLLWKIARSKIHNIFLPSGHLLYKVVLVAVLWLRLTREYQIFLELVGYSKDGVNISDNFCKPAKQHWKLISEMEKQLPAEAIASAWHVARYQAALKEPIAESPGSSHPKSFCMILLPIAVIWGAILKIIETILTFFLVYKNSAKSPFDHLSMISEMSNPRCCYHLSFGKISTVMSPIQASHRPINKIASLRSRNYFKDPSSFHLLVEGLLIIYEEGIIEQFMSFSVGFLEGTSVPILDSSEDENDSRNSTLKDGVVDAKTIVCGEPALLHTDSENEEAGSAACPSPEQLLGEMKLTWQRLHARFKAMENSYDGKPWAMCDTRTFGVYPGLKSPDSGFSKCSLVVGKLNFELGYSSVLSIAMFILQLQHALYQVDVSESSASLRTLHESQKTNWSDGLKSSVKDLTVRLLRLIPDEHVEVRAIIAGPRVNISMGDEEILDGSRKANATYGPDEINLTIDVQDSHFSVWPTAESGTVSCREHQKPDAVESAIFKLHEPISSGFSESDNTIYASKGLISLCGYLRFGGLNAYFKDPIESCTMQFFILKPVTAKFTVLRDYLHAFGGSVVASSLSWYGSMTGGTGLFYMDELSVVLQVVGRLLSAASATASGFSLNNARHVIVERQGPHTESENKKTAVETCEGAALNIQTTSFSVKASFELGHFDIILHNSRNGLDKRGFSRVIDAYDIRKLGLAELPDYGIWFSFQGASIDISVRSVKAELDVKLGGFHAVIFVSKNQVGNDDKSDADNAVQQSMNCLQEVSLSTCTFNLLFDCKDDLEASTRTYSATSSNSSSDLLSDSPSTIDSESLNPMSAQDKDLSGVLAQTPSPWLCIKSTIDVVFMGTCSVKNGILEAHAPDKLCFSLSIGGDFQSICIWSQGGYIFVETTVLARFVHCFSSYLHCIRTISFVEYQPRKSLEIAEPALTMSILDNNDFAQSTQSIAQLDHHGKRGLWELLSVHLSQFSLVLLATDESGLVKEIIGEVDLSMKLWLENRRKFVFKLSYLNILSQIFDGGLRQTEKIIQIPHFSSVVSNYESLWLNYKDSTAAVPQKESSFLLPKDASSSISPNYMESSSYDSAVPVFQESGRKQNHILQHFGISISAEKPLAGDENGQDCIGQGWVGNGSVSGLNVTISLSEIQMLMATIESFSEVAGKDAAHDVKGRNSQSINQEPEKDLEAALPEGAVVAIQDVHQHMYVTVDSAENKFRLASALHYSLVGRRALFRVKWQRSRWLFSESCFSLISLFAKNDSGDPLRLNYSTSSGFVDISCNNDSSCALWKIASCKHEGYEDDVDLEPLNNLSNNTFYLVNKKNDCGAAFIDGTLEFVKKPGNPFKFKVFNGLSLDNDSMMSESCQQEDHGLVDQAGIVPCINISIEKASLTIVHELHGAEGKFNLLQGCTDGTEVTVQILPPKTRVMSSLTAVLYVFDVYTTIWRELVHPTEISIYVRSRSNSHSPGGEISNKSMQSRLYLRMKELELSITELSLDTLLYVVGKLDLAGPFSVKNSAIFANCCKVENQTELNLFCHFYDGQSAKVDRRQSATFFLRNLVDLTSEASHATFRLESPEMSSTSSIHVPLSESQIFAWRTRIGSQRDSRTSPGPFIVYDISKNAEEGLSLVVSPLLRICNQTGFPVELRIQRPEQMEAETVSVLLREGETVDDCMAAFDAINLLGGPKKALLSLGVGNFVLSFRPEIKGDGNNSVRSYSVEWSDNLRGGKAVRLSGVIDKLSYQVRKALSAESWKYSFSTASCSVGYENAHVTKMHFLVQSIGREVPITLPNGHPKSKNLSIALQEQKEVFLLPTVRVSNLLDSDIDVLLSETEMPSTNGLKNINQATISSGLTVDLYANPAVIFFKITLMMFGSSCKPVNCGHWLKKLNKRKDGVQFLDIDLEYCGGNFFACLRLARGNRGILEAIVFTHYTLRNETDFPLFCATPNMKLSSRGEAERGVTTPPHLGSFLPPKSIRSWFLKSSKLRLKLLDEETSQSNLDLDVLSGLAEISFTKFQGTRSKHLVKFGVSLRPLTSKTPVPSQVVSIVPRYVICNESDEQIFVRQCFIEDDLDETVSLNSKQKRALSLRIGSSDKGDISVLDRLLQKHRMSDDDASTFVQFRPNEAGLAWSGPVCVASLGHFFLKFKRSSPIHQSDIATREHETTAELAGVHVVEEASTFVLHFHRPPDIDLPYRIENDLHHASITYYQKDTFDPETLASRSSVNYVWDDLTRPRKLMVKINGINMLREISLDKLRSWKPFFRARQQRELASDLPIDYRIVEQRRKNPIQTNAINAENVGYAVYADGPTRVLRISDSSGSFKGDRIFQSCKKIQFRISYFAIHLLEHHKQESPGDVDPYEESTYTPIVVGRLENISLDSILIDQRKYNQIRVQSMHVDEKWVGAPFAAMLRRHLSNETDDCTLFVVFVLYPTRSSVREVKYLSIVLQPIDLNLDEETLLRIVPFWRKSLSTNTQYQQYYFDHFEIHPVKIIASFLPVDSYSSYSSGQETLRSLLHSVIKIPAIKNMVVELNGVLVTHALVTTRELLLRCAQHYSWHAMRAIYIAKGSSLLPPTFASVFDDLASSSLDVFFDPSSSLFNVRGLTLGTFKLVSKCIQNKGFSGTKRYFGDLSKTLKNAGSSVLFAAVTEISDSVLKGAESSGLNGVVTGFHHGILKLAMEPSFLGTAFMEGGPDRKIMLDRSPGVNELYIEGYLQAMLDTIYKQEYLRVRVIDNQVILKNLPPNSSLIGEIMDRVKEFLVSKALLKGDFSTSSRPLRHLRGEHDWRIGPTVLTLCEHLFVSFAIRMLRKHTENVVSQLKLKGRWVGKGDERQSGATAEEPKGKRVWRWGIGRFVLSAMVAYVDGRLCRYIPHPIARRIVSGFLLSFLDTNKDSK